MKVFTSGRVCDVYATLPKSDRNNKETSLYAISIISFTLEILVNHSSELSYVMYLIKSDLFGLWIL